MAAGKAVPVTREPARRHSRKYPTRFGAKRKTGLHHSLWSQVFELVLAITKARTLRPSSQLLKDLVQNRGHFADAACLKADEGPIVPSAAVCAQHGAARRTAKVLRPEGMAKQAPQVCHLQTRPAQLSSHNSKPCPSPGLPRTFRNAGFSRSKDVSAPLLNVCYR